MTDRDKAVELIAQAMATVEQGTDVDWQAYAEPATAILAQIAPLLTAQAVEAERAACTEELRLAVAAARVGALREAASVAGCAPYKRGGLVCGCSEGLGNYTAAAILALINAPEVSA